MIMSIPTQRTTRAIQRSRLAACASVPVMGGTVADRLVRDDLVRSYLLSGRATPHRLRALDGLGEPAADEARERGEERRALLRRKRAQDVVADRVADRLGLLDLLAARLRH